MLRNFYKLFIYFLLFSKVNAAVPSTGQIQDPTRPSGYVEEGENPWKLNAVIISPRRRIAVINGKSLTVGEEINGQQVISIDQDAVVIKGPNGTMTLNLIEKPVKNKIYN